MFKKLFRKTSTTSKEVSCQVIGNKATITDTVSLVKINSIIVTKHIGNIEIDYSEKTINSSKKPPIKYYREILVPNELQQIFGRLFAQVEDEDDLELSTAIISEEGIRKFTGISLMKIGEYLKQHALIQIPNSMFFPIISKEEILVKKVCENWNEEFNGVGRKYMSKYIIDRKIERQQFGRPGILYPGYDVGISDVSNKNPQGHGYLFKTDKQFKKVDLCSNESAVDYCKKNNVLIYYNDFMNKGNLRLLSEYTPKINQSLQNPYKYRTSNI